MRFGNGEEGSLNLDAKASVCENGDCHGVRSCRNETMDVMVCT